MLLSKRIVSACSNLSRSRVFMVFVA
jgi:hypothetical protein